MNTDLAWTRQRRLRGRPAFDRVAEEGRVSAGRDVVVRALTDAGEGPARIGIVTPRKLGGAVVRNRVRRRVREVLRTHQEQLPEGSWIVIYPKRGLENAAFETLRDSLLDALESALKESR